MRPTVSELSCLGECELTILLDPAGIPGEIYNHINGLTVETTTYERLFFAYTELEKASGRA